MGPLPGAAVLLSEGISNVANGKPRQRHRRISRSGGRSARQMVVQSEGGRDQSTGGIRGTQPYLLSDKDRHRNCLSALHEAGASAGHGARGDEKRGRPTRKWVQRCPLGG